MKERPIIFSSKAINDILVDEKLQTRRVMKPQPLWLPEFNTWVWKTLPGGGYRYGAGECEGFAPFSHYGEPGDLLWVREAMFEDPYGIWRYEADCERVECDPVNASAMTAWLMHIDRQKISPMHMPKWACRLRLSVLDVRVQRLQDISEEDAKAEGALPAFEVDAATFIRGKNFDPEKASTYKIGFKMAWNETHGQKQGESWADNPFVFAITFRRAK